MAREKADFRDNLELIRERFGDKAVLTQQEVTEYTGLSRYMLGQAGILKKIGGRYMVTAVALAKYLS